VPELATPQRVTSYVDALIACGFVLRYPHYVIDCIITIEREEIGIALLNHLRNSVGVDFHEYKFDTKYYGFKPCTHGSYKDIIKEFQAAKPLGEAGISQSQDEDQLGGGDEANMKKRKR
jgi:hypothetical protein